MGFLMEPPELPEPVEGRIQLIGVAVEVIIVHKSSKDTNWLKVSRKHTIKETI